MGLFDRRRQASIPPDAKTSLTKIEAEFRDDGCSNALDGILGFDFAWACRIHDWEYCTRTQPQGSMTYGKKVCADERLKRFIYSALPWWLDWAPPLYHFGVFLGGGFAAFDSCGPGPYGANEEQRVAGLCRHSLPMPGWMAASARAVARGAASPHAPESADPP